MRSWVERGKARENTGVLGKNLSFPIFSQGRISGKISVSPYSTSASCPRKKCLKSREFSAISPCWR